MRLLPVLLLACAAIAAPARTEDAPPCRNGLFPEYEGGFRMGTIGPGPRVHFHRDWPAGECPHGDGCRERAYLVPGDAVLLAHAHGEWTCVWYSGTDRAFVGWLPAARIAVEPATTPDDFEGDWSTFHDTASLQVRNLDDGRIAVTGAATWHGIAGNVNVGEVHGTGRPERNRVRIDEPGDGNGCTLWMERVGADLLVVHDNALCGGLNVRFDNVYRRTPPGTGD
ncbi:hypothetical protein [Coralloluteibacterium thermophilus]|uniref:SH3 domain-containing protein n=1 Tax=Coralloluteibacterium thermophilum TaxID=2707049 RepID=A0ABV9NQI4_9GAMM